MVDRACHQSSGTSYERKSPQTDFILIFLRLNESKNTRYDPGLCRLDLVLCLEPLADLSATAQLGPRHFLLEGQSLAVTLRAPMVHFCLRHYLDLLGLSL